MELWNDYTHKTRSVMTYSSYLQQTDTVESSSPELSELKNSKEQEKTQARNLT